ncbi:uncharacterized protein LOC121321036 [Polyodon spathula]|uniref:uncharacterized protein LOC121321036 n=1 Tax=Polyodon spathula TaxID=7913 RepID=UPI001B7EE1B7|nr:uncharacterized protein LOC121321036 [Polyodon spathula]
MFQLNLDPQTRQPNRRSGGLKGLSCAAQVESLDKTGRTTPTETPAMRRHGIRAWLGMLHNGSGLYARPGCRQSPSGRSTNVNVLRPSGRCPPPPAEEECLLCPPPPVRLGEALPQSPVHEEEAPLSPAHEKETPLSPAQEEDYLPLPLPSPGGEVELPLPPSWLGAPLSGCLPRVRCCCRHTRVCCCRHLTRVRTCHCLPRDWSCLPGRPSRYRPGRPAQWGSPVEKPCTLIEGTGQSPA